jgi:hypothetical protein
VSGWNGSWRSCWTICRSSGRMRGWNGTWQSCWTIRRSSRRMRGWNGTWQSRWTIRRSRGRMRGRNRSRRSRWTTSISSTLTAANEPFLVLALLPQLRGSALGWWRCVVKNFVKLRVVHIKVDLSEAEAITVSRIGERRIERHRLFFITECHTVLHKVGRNPHDISLVINFPRLGHTKSNSLFRTRNDLDWFHHVNGARLALRECETAVRTVVATTRSRRRSGRWDKTWNTGRSGRRAGGRINCWSSCRYSGGSTARSSTGRHTRNSAGR